MKNKVLLSRLCICTLTVSLLAGCSSAGSTSETANNSETESISSETASETSSESESATTASASFASPGPALGQFSGFFRVLKYYLQISVKFGF